MVKARSSSVYVSTECNNAVSLLTLGIAGILLGWSPLDHAAGLSLVDFNSVSAFGTAGAGRGVNAADASVMSSNPAGMALLDRQQVVLGGMGIFAGGEATGRYYTPATDRPAENLDPSNVAYYTSYGSPGNYYSCTEGTCYQEPAKEDDFLHPAFVPSLYYAQPVTHNIWAGVGVYASFGGETDYPVESPFRYQALSSKTQVVVVQPTMSYRIDETLSIGAGLQLAVGKLEMSRMLNPWATSVTNARADIDGEGVGVGLNLGLIWQPVDTVALGLAYHSPVRVKFEGDLKATNVSALGVVMDRFANGEPAPYPEPIPAAEHSANWIIQNRPGTLTEDAKTTITFPEHVDLSLSWAMDSKWTLLANATWTRWSRLERFKITASGAASGYRASDIVSVSNGAPGGNVVAWVPQEWSDVWSYALGMHYQFSDKLVLKAGYSYDNSPTKDETRSARIPDNDRQWLTLGAGYRFNDTYSLDVAYGYMVMKSFTIHDANHKVDGSRQGTNDDTTLFEDPGMMQAKYRDMHAHALAAQLTMRF